MGDLSHYAHTVWMYMFIQVFILNLVFWMFWGIWAVTVIDKNILKYCFAFYGQCVQTTPSQCCYSQHPGFQISMPWYQIFYNGIVHLPIALLKASWQISSHLTSHTVCVLNIHIIDVIFVELLVFDYCFGAFRSWECDILIAYLVCIWSQLCVVAKDSESLVYGLF